MKKILSTFLAIIMVASVFSIESLAYDEASVDYEKIYLQSIIDSQDDWFLAGSGAMLVDINSDGIPEMLTAVEEESSYSIRECFSIIDGKVVKDKNRGTYTIIMPFLMGEIPELPTEEYVGVYIDGNNRHCLAMYGSSFGVSVTSEITYDETSGFGYKFNDMSVYDYELRQVPCAYVKFDGGVYSTASQLCEAISTLASEYKNKVANFEQESGYNCSSWAQEEIKEAARVGLIPEGMESEDLTAEVTREEFAAIAIKYLEAKDFPLTWHGGYIVDIEDCQYEDSIRGAYNLGITNGVGTREDGGVLFSPHVSTTREQIATMLYRTLETEAEFNLKTEAWFNVPDDSDYMFQDDEEISDYAYQPVYFMNYKNIIQGIGNDLFAPKETATKEQAIILSLRMYNEFDNSENSAGKSVIEIMTADEIREINIFLSNFSEVCYKGNEEYYSSLSQEEEKLDFAFSHALLNSPEKTNLPGNRCGLTVSDVDTILYRFFGETIAHNTFNSSYLTYQDGCYVAPVVDGDFHAYFSIATEVIFENDGTYTICFNVFADRNITEDPYVITDKSVYSLNNTQAMKNYDFVGTGVATVKPKVYNGKNTYELVDYSFDWC